MSNHYYLVLFINKEEVDALTDLEVIEWWRKINQGPDVIQRFIDGEKLSKVHYELIAEIVFKWRNRLENISWFMPALNEPIQRTKTGSRKISLLSGKNFSAKLI